MIYGGMTRAALAALVVALALEPSTSFTGLRPAARASGARRVVLGATKEPELDIAAESAEPAVSRCPMTGTVVNSAPAEAPEARNGVAAAADVATGGVAEPEHGGVKLVLEGDDLQGRGEIKGLPWWWNYFWKLPFTKPGQAGEPLKLGDTMQIFKQNIEEIYGGYPSADGVPLAEGKVDGLQDGTMYLGLYEFYQNQGGLFKLCFGPKSFTVVSDTEILKYVLRDNAKGYDKGILAEILEPIMGKGLIPADPETWNKRRRAIVPGFHKAWLSYMSGMFGHVTEESCTNVFDKAAEAGDAVDVEHEFGSLALNIIGKAVFNYDFNAEGESNSPVVTAAIATLREAEHRSMTPAPYWKLPFATDLVPRQREFKENMNLLDSTLDDCVREALSSRKETDIEDLERRDYSKLDNPSLLRFLVDARGEETDSKQLRDDLMTMLIAGHETTASALTWAVYELAQNSTLLARVQEEVDTQLGDRLPNMDEVKDLELVRLCVAESLRMYPEPPLLIRRALEDDVFPEGGVGFQAKIARGTDIFIALYNIHRDGRYWPEPHNFDPERFLRPHVNPEEAPWWKGYNPGAWSGQLYPTENSADFAFAPFGAGPRKCVGDQFAMLEATVALAMFLRRYDFEFTAPTEVPAKVGTNTGATIHTRNGLWMKLKKRKHD
uniref:Cytochrome P450 n=1 Tax=Phaeomonas parva TaxID=124430 RepID=A0A7S1ULN7_9STRA|mmetsp:Transcript_8221/g.23392  ORF Transcript_8221/g.23392 Transcript_8221/m.23392 type:complete len:665 (+) Transcript_8221:452-2446(+)|eukprot:CAMPEP_0118852786 /NCGR_PEP_ID=MMETSP1163-20130328/1639_1 /TAXON_ID=124430 /ORGANISM="Phaeomonas parva, Strain CCMP2877" /LENGTH=664 /DNA_ID=CAMNT_0006785251 /DNA_START=422 /DNA_END=2416 /DNA_ORIENTATION=+